MAMVKLFQAHSNSINRIKQSPFNNYVATSSWDSAVKIWNSFNNSWNLIRTYTGHQRSVDALEWINEDVIASGADDGTIQIWSIKSGQIVQYIYLGLHTTSLKLLSNGIYLAASIYNIANINIYNANTAQLVTTLRGHTDSILDLELINAEILASASRDQTIRIWNLTTNECTFILQGHSSLVYSLKLIS